MVNPCTNPKQLPHVAASVNRLSVSLPCCDWDINLIHVYTVLHVSRLAVNHTELGRIWHLPQSATWTHHRHQAPNAVPVHPVSSYYILKGTESKNKTGGYKGMGGGVVGCKEKRRMAMGKCHSLNILSGSFPTLPLSFCPSFSSCLSSSHLSPSFSLSSSAYLSLLLT